jgi:riboflavin biosynthesis pyrimidine reductase
VERDADSVLRLDVLYEAGGMPAFPLPDELADAYGGSLGFQEPRLFANFVSSVDGVVSIPAVPGSVQLIGGRSEADRFLMALLRACADALLVGAGTFRGSREPRWTPESLHPDGKAAFAELRRRLGRTRPPELAVLTGSGHVDPGHPAFAAGALVLTTDDGAERLAGRLPRASSLVALGPAIDPARAVEALRARGHRLILSEGGPTLLGSLLEAGAVDELFLTVSPVLAGRPAGDGRLALVEGAELLPGCRVGGRLLGVRRDGEHLFLRYGLARE